MQRQCPNCGDMSSSPIGGRMKWKCYTQKPPIKRGESQSAVFIGRHRLLGLLAFVQYIDYKDGDGFHWCQIPK